MKTTILYGAIIVIVVGGLLAVRFFSDGPSAAGKTTKYDAFAQCLADAGAQFYGAFWCPHCREQKALFENSSQIPYVECSTPDGQAQLQVCIDEGITGYPTWRFSDGSELGGVQQLSALAEKTSCELPL